MISWENGKSRVVGRQNDEKQKNHKTGVHKTRKAPEPMRPELSLIFLAVYGAASGIPCEYTQNAGPTTGNDGICWAILCEIQPHFTRANHSYRHGRQDLQY